MKGNNELRKKAKLFWGMDLNELESSLGVKDPVTSLPVDEIDERVPPQGSVLLDKIDYLPEEE